MDTFFVLCSLFFVFVLSSQTLTSRHSPQYLEVSCSQRWTVTLLSTPQWCFNSCESCVSPNFNVNNAFADHNTVCSVDAVFIQPWLGPREALLPENRRRLMLLGMMSDKDILLLDYCSARSLVSLRRTCTTFKTAVDMYITQRFNVDRILTRYFTDPKSFRYLQACTGTLISGSSALQFFDRSFYPHSDLDLYVSKVWGPRVGHFLSQEGYSFVPGQHQHPTFDSAVIESEAQTNAAVHVYGNFKGIAGVYTFEKIGKDGDTLKVQIMFAARTPIEVILRFHSSEFSDSICSVYLCRHFHGFFSCCHERYCIRSSILFIPQGHPWRTALPSHDDSCWCGDSRSLGSLYSARLDHHSWPCCGALPYFGPMPQWGVCKVD